MRRQRRFLNLSGLTLAACLMMVASGGCNNSARTTPPIPRASRGNAQAGARAGTGLVARTDAPATAIIERKTAILESVIKLIQQAATNPGGDHFGTAIKNLNQYFAENPSSDYVLAPKAREFLLDQLSRIQVEQLESPAWVMQDARHVEDCMLYQGIAARVSGPGDDVTRVRRVFDWMIRQVELVPVGSLGSQGLQQAYARPYDVLLRGMATEAPEGGWSERGWLFLSLCRQLGLDSGLLTYTPPGLKEPIVWCCVVLIDGKPYLFDTRIGLAIPDAAGTGVATLDEAMTNPAILARMDLPGQSPYGTTREALAASPSKIGVLIDSSPRYFSPRMKLLQASLAGKDVTILFRDPALQRDSFAAALGDRLGKVSLWDLPMEVERLLFTSQSFVTSTQNSLFMFRSEFPLLIARMKRASRRDRSCDPRLRVDAVPRQRHVDGRQDADAARVSAGDRRLCHLFPGDVSPRSE